MKNLILISISVIFLHQLNSQEAALVNTNNSKFAKLSSVNINDITLTDGFWAERFSICKDSMITSLWRIYNDSSISHAYRNFEIAAGLKPGDHKGPPFHDGDFYKLLEGIAMVYSYTKDRGLDSLMDSIINTIAKSQREDGYIHTPVIIEEKKSGKKTEFRDRLNFETYNMGHLMTAACIHYRVTGKKSLLNVAIKAADYLYSFYEKSSPELARNAICPSHYMGVVELYRTTKDKKYLDLAKNLIDIRGLVENGTDDNQDRIPFRQQKKAMGHAVRANYLYAGVADVYMETGDDSLFTNLNLIWNDLVTRKMYVTGGCGALYDGTSPDGTSYKPNEVQKVHQAYGRDYQLPNLTAHNESCANIGSLLWNWRMFQITGNAKYMEILELVFYNSVLAGVSLDGKRYFYTNPLKVSDDITFKLRWSKEREEYIKKCNCCPPNTVRTIAEAANYFYSVSDKGLYINLYGSNRLSTELKDGSKLKLIQQTQYPWDGDIKISIEEISDKKSKSLFFRIPEWCTKAELKINGKDQDIACKPGEYLEVNRIWKKNDVIELNLPMNVDFIEANPLVEETRNQVTVKRGPIVYCLESTDVPENVSINDIMISPESTFVAKTSLIEKSKIVFLEGNVRILKKTDWENKLYNNISVSEKNVILIKLIPYYAWGNRGHSEMSVWIPVSR